MPTIPKVTQMDSDGGSMSRRVKDTSVSSTSTDEEEVLSVSSGATENNFSEGQGIAAGITRGEHRDLIIASLLEDHFRTLAAELYNSTAPAGSPNYSRHSPEIQPLARRLYDEATQRLSSNKLLPSPAASDTSRDTRAQYIAGLDSLTSLAGAPNTPAGLVSQFRDLTIQPFQGRAILPFPTNSLQLSQPQPHPRKSHYSSSFQEVSLLGKGGFGKVYRCYSPLDQSTYAVKKIALSDRLWKTFCDGNHEKLSHILKEAQALAKLDHPNVVRYHQAWFDEPEQFPVTADSQSLMGHSYWTTDRGLDSLGEDEADGDTDADQSASYGVVFGEDTPSLGSGQVQQYNAGPEWSDNSTEELTETKSATNDSDIFTDDRSRSMNNGSSARQTSDANVHTLCIQMSLYPMSLAQYISRSPSRNGSPRHCFHLVPSLRILLAILAGIRYIHSKGMVHRDIKPGNIFLSALETECIGGYCDITCCSCPTQEQSCGRWLNPRIGDFGLVTQLAHGEIPPLSKEIYRDSTDHEPLGISKDVGTALYRPPKWDNIRNSGVHLDIFALGVVLVEMLCPFGTVMERADTLNSLQKGDGSYLSSIENRLVAEGHGADTQTIALDLVGGMVQLDPTKRLSAVEIADLAHQVLSSCDGKTG
ncbi:eukaryotic translation initiation factor 2-alpha kinase [Apiospora kogelbergensis]|uniref:eukaryotic translation initiation factor 2-alpha kinase n=1 Tax=Apiospora kogelbergensis TaxID=1337665 RepID=UPI0031301EE7